MAKNSISMEMEKAVSDGVFPGAVLLCAKDQKIVFHEAYGMADCKENRRMCENSIFDLASLTKPLATTLAIARLIEKKQLELDQPIGSIIDAFASTPKADITIDMLLRHTSGFPAHREYYKQVVTADENPKQVLRQLLIHEPLDNKIGEHQVYSDLGFMVLSWIVEQVSGQRLDHFVAQQVYAYLEIDNLFFMDLVSKKKIANPIRQKIVATQECPWRKKLLVGEVDDDNAWAVGGIEGHAGLFGDAVSIYSLCCDILNAVQNKPTKILPGDVLTAFVAKKNHQDMVAGFDTPSKTRSSSGRYFSNASIGHLGFTGTSFWIDPETSLMVVLLTNRVHPDRTNLKLKKFRPKIHDLIYTELL